MLKRRLVRLILFLCAAATAVGLNQDIRFVPHPEESRNGQPDLTFTADGTAWLAWPSFQQGEIKLAVSSSRGGRWSPIILPDPSPGAQLDPRWADGPGVFGNPNLVYSVYAGGQWKVRHLFHRTRSWSDPVDLGKGIHPAAAMTRAEIWAAWEDEGRIMIRKKTDRFWKQECICIEPKRAFGEHLSHPRLASGP